MRGADAPVDIAGRSPYGAMATSAQGLARTNRKALEGALYSPDDPSVRGDVAPARMRSNGSGLLGSPMMSPNIPRTNSRVTFEGGKTSGGNGYLSPGPRKGGMSPRRSPTPFVSRRAAAAGTTPFASPAPALLEESAAVSSENKNQPLCASSLVWGVSEMNGRRIHMEDRVLVRYPMDAPPNEGNPTASATSMGIFGVFDGHGDGGYASEFVASNLVSALEGHPDWSAAYRGACSAGSAAAAPSPPGRRRPPRSPPGTGPATRDASEDRRRGIGGGNGGRRSDSERASRVVYVVRAPGDAAGE